MTTTSNLERPTAKQIMDECYKQLLQRVQGPGMNKTIYLVPLLYDVLMTAIAKPSDIALCKPIFIPAPSGQVQVLCIEA
jgi:hypothetical protein